MKIVIRPLVYETNSSTTHSYARLNKEEFKKWQNNNYLFLGGHVKNSKGIYAEEGELYSEEEVIDFVKNTSHYYYSYDEIIERITNNIRKYYIYNQFGFFTYQDCLDDEGVDITEPSKYYNIVRTWFDG